MFVAAVVDAVEVPCFRKTREERAGNVSEGGEEGFFFCFGLGRNSSGTWASSAWVVTKGVDGWRVYQPRSRRSSRRGFSREGSVLGRMYSGFWGLEEVWEMVWRLERKLWKEAHLSPKMRVDFAVGALSNVK